MYNNKKENSVTNENIVFIYHSLMKLQFPALTNDEDSETEDLRQDNVEFVLKKIGKYLQGGDSRLYLLEWLINKFNPNLINPKPKIAKEDRIINIKYTLSYLGLLPVSRHSKNIEYNKYVEGLLGYQNSINLIYRLVQFVKQAVENRKKEKPDQNFSKFIKQLSLNKNQLVNTKHDPFGIAFPEVYGELSDEQFNAKYQILAKKIETYGSVQQIKLRAQQIGIGSDQSFLEISPEIKERYKVTLSQLRDLAKKKLKVKKGLVGQKQTTNLINLDNQFVNIYRKFTKMFNLQQIRDDGYFSKKKLLENKLNDF